MGEWVGEHLLDAEGGGGEEGDIREGPGKGITFEM